MEYDLEKLVLDILSKHKQLFQVGKERFPRKICPTFMVRMLPPCGE